MQPIPEILHPDIESTQPLAAPMRGIEAAREVGKVVEHPSLVVALVDLGCGATLADRTRNRRLHIHPSP
ncbi:hypothetical protein [Nocardia bhagyanarayanae]|uniref:hypothetical protein n=1 Tax=Nocardia bhagyanarayanae TaxID=1215925 RepID=UPI00114DCB6B|nr:hypothetical protein [Nocardia bhagyanarayanae]